MLTTGLPLAALAAGEIEGIAPFDSENLDRGAHLLGDISHNLRFGEWPRGTLALKQGLQGGLVGDLDRLDVGRAAEEGIIWRPCKLIRVIPNLQ